MLSTESSNFTVAHRARSHSGQSDLEADERSERSGNLAGLSSAARASGSSTLAFHSYTTAPSSLNSGASYRGASGTRSRHAVSITSVGGGSSARARGSSRMSQTYIPYESDVMLEDFSPAIGSHLEDEQDGASFGQRYNANTGAAPGAGAGAGASSSSIASAAPASAAVGSAIENPSAENLPQQPPPRPPPILHRDPSSGGMGMDSSMFEANFHIDQSMINQSPSNEMFFVPGEGTNSDDGAQPPVPSSRLARRFSGSDDD